MRRLVLVMIVATIPAGCAGEGPPTIRLIIDAEAAVEPEIDRIDLFARASRSPEMDLCAPFRRTYHIPSTRFPFVIDMVCGEEYTSWVVYRIVGSNQGQEVISRQKRLTWPSDGKMEDEILLTSNCLFAFCGADRQCIDGHCDDVLSSGAFDDEDSWPELPSCDVESSGQP